MSARRLSPDGNQVGLLSWREIEVEAVTGSDELLETIGGRLRDCGAREAAAGSKLERVLAEDLVHTERPSQAGTAPHSTRKTDRRARYTAEAAAASGLSSRR